MHIFWGGKGEIRVQTHRLISYGCTHITFEEIIKLNGHDWDRANAVLNYHLEKKQYQKRSSGKWDDDLS